MSNYINKTPKGERLGPEKASDIAAFCDEELHELPDFAHIPTGQILVVVVQNEAWEGALVCDTEKTWGRVHHAVNSGDKRPLRFFLVKREWVRQMADKPLESDQED